MLRVLRNPNIVCQAAVLALGVGYSLYLQTTIPPDVFYSCDGGLKFLLTKQLAETGLRGGNFDLDLPSEPWVRALWDAGLYPMAAPFVYPRDGLRYIGFPPFFSMLTAPLLAAFGMRGLYVVPLVSTWLIWIAFLFACRRSGIRPRFAVAGLAALVFASPLTHYSAMYWEHTLSVLLAFFAVVVARVHDRAGWHGQASSLGRGDAGETSADKPVRPAPWFIAGLLLALAGWLRPEQLAFACLAAAIFGFWRGTSIPARARAALAAGVALGIGGLFAFNWIYSGAPLGFHGEQVTTDPWVNFRNGPRRWLHLSSLLVQHLPMAVLVIPFALALRIGGVRVARHSWRLLALAVIFSLLVPFMLPSTGELQWGPRFFLVLMPIVCLLGAQMLQDAVDSGPRWLKASAIALFAGAVLAGAVQNTWFGTKDLKGAYAYRFRPLAERLRRSPLRIVVTTSQFISMELTRTFDQKIWFLADEARDFDILAAGLWANGQRQFLAVRPHPLEFPPSVTVQTPKGPLGVRFHAAGRAGQIRVFRAEIVPP